MTLRFKLLFAFLGVIAITLGINFFLVASRGRKMMLHVCERQAIAIKDLLCAATIFAFDLQDRTEDLVGKQMIVQATALAHLVDVAENEAHLTTEQIIERLCDLVDETVLDEIWITDESRHAYLRSNLGLDWTFPEKVSADDQASHFVPLLTQKRGQVVQRTMERSASTLAGKKGEEREYFKYAGVSGVDKPRIVQVGFNAESLARLSEGMRPADVARALAGNADVVQLRFVDDNGDVYEDFGPGRVIEASHATVRNPVLLKDIRWALAQDTTVSRLTEDHLYVAAPVEYGGQRLAILVNFDPTQVHALVRDALGNAAITFAVLLVVGVFLALRLSSGIASPLKKLADEADEIGKGNLDRRIDVSGSIEVDKMADAFNAMIASLKEHIEELRVTTARQQSLETEMQIAADVQRAMLPLVLPEVPGGRLAALTRPARVVGGDFYDAFVYPDGKIGLALGDATGKGLASALYVSQARSVLKTLSTETESAREVLERGNDIILENCQSEGRFITLFYGTYDPAARTLTFVSAGHMPPLLLRRGRLLDDDVWGEGAFPLAALSDFEGPETVVQLAPGDTVVLYSDGVTDARNEAGETFDLDRLRKAFAACGQADAQEVVDRIHRTVVGFVGAADQADDLTMLVLRVCD